MCNKSFDLNPAHGYNGAGLYFNIALTIGCEHENLDLYKL